MTRCTVTYHGDALNDLALLAVQHWGTKAGRDIARASDQIDKLLSMRPHLVGEPVCENVRLLVVRPLEIIYAIFEEDQLVIVVGVRFLSDIDAR